MFARNFCSPFLTTSTQTFALIMATFDKQREQSAFCAAVAGLRNSHFSDLTVKCGDRAFDVHKVVVSAASEWFKTALTGNFKVSQAPSLPSLYCARTLFSSEKDTTLHQRPGRETNAQMLTHRSRRKRAAARFHSSVTTRTPSQECCTFATTSTILTTARQLR